MSKGPWQPQSGLAIPNKKNVKAVRESPDVFAFFTCVLENSLVVSEMAV